MKQHQCQRRSMSVAFYETNPNYRRRFLYSPWRRIGGGVGIGSDGGRERRMVVRVQSPEGRIALIAHRESAESRPGVESDGLPDIRAPVNNRHLLSPDRQRQSWRRSHDFTRPRSGCSPVRTKVIRGCQKVLGSSTKSSLSVFIYLTSARDAAIWYYNYWEI